MKLAKAIEIDLSKNEKLDIKEIGYYLKIIRDNCNEFNTYKELDVLVSKLCEETNPNL